MDQDGGDTSRPFFGSGDVAGSLPETAMHDVISNDTTTFRENPLHVYGSSACWGGEGGVGSSQETGAQQQDQQSTLLHVLEKDLPTTEAAGMETSNRGAILNDTLAFKDNPLQVYGSSEDPLFKAAQVCAFLGLKNSREATSKLDDDEKCELQMQDVKGRTQTYVMVNEPGLYALIGFSRKPAAREFRRWVNHVVLPSIRRTGQYKRQRDDEATRFKLDMAEQAAKRLRADADFVKQQMDVFDTRLGGMDKRDKLNFRDMMRNSLFAQPAPAAAVATVAASGSPSAQGG